MYQIYRYEHLFAVAPVYFFSSRVAGLAGKKSKKKEKKVPHSFSLRDTFGGYLASALVMLWVSSIGSP